jgi:hypothetical protein
MGWMAPLRHRECQTGVSGEVPADYRRAWLQHNWAPAGERIFRTERRRPSACHIPLDQTLLTL